MIPADDWYDRGGFIPSPGWSFEYTGSEGSRDPMFEKWIRSVLQEHDDELVQAIRAPVGPSSHCAVKGCGAASCERSVRLRDGSTLDVPVCPTHHDMLQGGTS